VEQGLLQARARARERRLRQALARSALVNPLHSLSALVFGKGKVDPATDDIDQSKFLSTKFKSISSIIEVEVLIRPKSHQF
jgi:hypothetical protein